MENTSPDMIDAASDTTGQYTVGHLIEITSELADIFAKENALLSASRAHELAPLQNEKARLANTYAKAIREVAANRHEVEDTNVELLTNLRDITQRFNKLTATQSALLDGAQKVSKGIVDSVVKEAQKTDSANRTNLNSYNDQAKTHSSKKPVVMSMNECA